MKFTLPVIYPSFLWSRTAAALTLEEIRRAEATSQSGKTYEWKFKIEINQIGLINPRHRFCHPIGWSDHDQPIRIGRPDHPGGKTPKVQNATFVRVKPIIPRFLRIGFQFERTPGRSAQFIQKWRLIFLRFRIDLHFDSIDTVPSVVVDRPVNSLDDFMGSNRNLWTTY